MKMGMAEAIDEGMDHRRTVAHSPRSRYLNPVDVMRIENTLSAVRNEMELVVGQCRNNNWSPIALKQLEECFKSIHSNLEAGQQVLTAAPPGPGYAPEWKAGQLTASDHDRLVGGGGTNGNSKAAEDLFGPARSEATKLYEANTTRPIRNGEWKVMENRMDYLDRRILDLTQLVYNLERLIIRD
jgi:hypothetical protein